MTGTTPNPIKRATETKLVVKLGKLDVLMQWNMAAFWASSAGTIWAEDKNYILNIIYYIFKEMILWEIFIQK